MFSSASKSINEKIIKFQLKQLPNPLLNYKKAPNSFNIFIQEKIKEYKNINNPVESTELLSKISKEWKSADQQKYREMAETQKISNEQKNNEIINNLSAFDLILIKRRRNLMKQLGKRFVQIKPKKPKTATDFNLFVKHIYSHPELKNEMVGSKTAAEALPALRQKYNELPESEKLVYKQRSQALKATVEEYKSTFGFELNEAYKLILKIKKLAVNKYK